MDREHKRRCWDCGNVAVHEDSITPHVLCKKCGSQDTRRIPPDFKHSNKLHPSPEMEVRMDEAKVNILFTEHERLVGNNCLELFKLGDKVTYQHTSNFIKLLTDSRNKIIEAIRNDQ